MKISRLTAACIIALLLTLAAAAPRAQAGSLGLTIKFPDIVVNGGLAGDYDGSVFHVYGGPGLLFGLDLDGVGGNEYELDGFTGGGTYDLKAQISSAGQLVSGSFRVEGALYDPNIVMPVTIASGIALEGDLKLFGGSENGAGGGDFEFTFVNATGYLRDLGLFPSSSGGIIIGAKGGTYFDATGFTQPFTLNTLDVNTFVPTPMALPAGMVLLSGIVLSRLRRRGVGC
jgi:hypothetical protein